MTKVVNVEITLIFVLNDSSTLYLTPMISVWTTKGILRYYSTLPASYFAEEFMRSSGC